MLALEDLLLCGGVRVAFVIARAGNARGGATVVLVNVLRITAALVINAATVGALPLAFSFTLGGRVRPTQLLWKMGEGQ